MNASLLIESSQTKILVDCGEGTISRLRAIGLRPTDATNILITHCHPDHMCQLGGFILQVFSENLFFKGGSKGLELKIFCPQVETERLRKHLDLYRLRLTRLQNLAVEINSLKPNKTIFIDDIRVSSKKADHTAPTVVTRYEHKDLSLCYSSDTRPCEPVIKLSKDVDFLIHEATFFDEEDAAITGHSTPRQAGEIAKKANARKLFLVGMMVEALNDLNRVKSEAKKAYDGPIIIPNDLEQYLLTS